MGNIGQFENVEPPEFPGSVRPGKKKNKNIIMLSLRIFLSFYFINTLSIIINTWKKYLSRFVILLVDEGLTCAVAGALCHNQASCVDYEQGDMCCICKPGYFGNGITCIKEGNC